jgi:hypothetical protein
MDALTAFGLFAVIAMLICYALEDRSHWFVLAFAPIGRPYLDLGWPGTNPLACTWFLPVLLRLGCEMPWQTPARSDIAALRELRLAKEAQEVRTEILTGNQPAKPKPKKRFR